MAMQTSIFNLFGGIRPMARALSEPSSNVSAWKREGRIPAHKQPHVWTIARKLDLPITAELIIFPLGVPRSPTTAAGPFLTRKGNARKCNRQSISDAVAKL